MNWWNDEVRFFELKKTQKNKMYKKTDPDAITVFVVLFAIVTIVAEIVILSKIESFSSEQIGLSFIGIIATFVVISNFAHVIETRNKVKEDLEKMEDKVEKIAGLEECYDYFIKNDIARVLKRYGVNTAFSIQKDRMRIKHIGDLVFLVRIKVKERTEEGKIEKDKFEYWYYKVDIQKETASDSSKEEFEEFNKQ